MEISGDYIQGDKFLFANRVTDIKEITRGKFILSFKKQFGFKAGQVVAISNDRYTEPRIYSLCSGTDDVTMQILFDLKEEGTLTPKLSRLKPGDRLYVSKPYGTFLPHEGHPMWWIATGTGIAPFHAMLRSGYKAEKLIHGAREESHFYFENDFKEALQENYIRCLSWKDANVDFSGRVTSYLETCNNLPKNIKYYLCGRALMVVEVRDLLIAKEVPYENIVSEIFF